MNRSLYLLIFCLLLAVLGATSSFTAGNESLQLHQPALGADPVQPRITFHPAISSAMFMHFDGVIPCNPSCQTGDKLRLDLSAISNYAQIKLIFAHLHYKGKLISTITASVRARNIIVLEFLIQNPIHWGDSHKTPLNSDGGDGDDPDHDEEQDNNDQDLDSIYILGEVHLFTPIIFPSTAIVEPFPVPIKYTYNGEQALPPVDILSSVILLDGGIYGQSLASARIGLKLEPHETGDVFLFHIHAKHFAADATVIAIHVSGYTEFLKIKPSVACHVNNLYITDATFQNDGHTLLLKLRSTLLEASPVTIHCDGIGLKAYSMDFVPGVYFTIQYGQGMALAEDGSDDGSHLDYYPTERPQHHITLNGDRDTSQAIYGASTTARVLPRGHIVEQQPSIIHGHSVVRCSLTLNTANVDLFSPNDSFYLSAYGIRRITAAASQEGQARERNHPQNQHTADGHGDPRSDSYSAAGDDDQYTYPAFVMVTTPLQDRKTLSDEQFDEILATYYDDYSRKDGDNDRNEHPASLQSSNFAVIFRNHTNLRHGIELSPQRLGIEPEWLIFPQITITTVIPAQSKIGAYSSSHDAYDGHHIIGADSQASCEMRYQHYYNDHTEIYDMDFYSIASSPIPLPYLHSPKSGAPRVTVIPYHNTTSLAASSLPTTTATVFSWFSSLLSWISPRRTTTHLHKEGEKQFRNTFSLFIPELVVASNHFTIDLGLHDYMLEVPLQRTREVEPLCYLNEIPLTVTIPSDRDVHKPDDPHNSTKHSGDEGRTPPKTPLDQSRMVVSPFALAITLESTIPRGESFFLECTDLLLLLRVATPQKKFTHHHQSPSQQRTPWSNSINTPLDVSADAAGMFPPRLASNIEPRIQLFTITAAEPSAPTYLYQSAVFFTIYEETPSENNEGFSVSWLAVFVILAVLVGTSAILFIVLAAYRRYCFTHTPKTKDKDSSHRHFHHHHTTIPPGRLTSSNTEHDGSTAAPHAHAHGETSEDTTSSTDYTEYLLPQDAEDSNMNLLSELGVNTGAFPQISTTTPLLSAPREIVQPIPIQPRGGALGRHGNNPAKSLRRQHGATSYHPMSAVHSHMVPSSHTESYIPPTHQSMSFADDGDTFHYEPTTAPSSAAPFVSSQFSIQRQ